MEQVEDFLVLTGTDEGLELGVEGGEVEGDGFVLREAVDIGGLVVGGDWKGLIGGV